MVWTILWCAWLAWFAVEEGLALTRGGSGATLSAHVWRWFATDRSESKPRSGLVRLRKVILLAFLVWLLVHMMTGGWV